jgi:hypothetical protein
MQREGTDLLQAINAFEEQIGEVLGMLARVLNERERPNRRDWDEESVDGGDIETRGRFPRSF